MKRRWQALVVLLLLGVLKVPVERVATGRLLEAGLLSRPADFGPEAGKQLGQIGIAATLGGLRSLVASIVYMQAYIAWENVDWVKVDQLFGLATLLQPRYANYWDEASWHMAFNAANYYATSEGVPATLRQELRDQHIQRGLDILHHGLRVLPDDTKLWSRLAELYDRQAKDPAKSGEAYWRVYSLSGQRLMARLAGYQFAATENPNLWRRAYDILMEAYRKDERPPSVITNLKNLEERLNIPPPRRIPDPAPQLPVPKKSA